VGNRAVGSRPQRRLGQKVAGAGSSNSPTDICKFPTEEIMCPQNFVFAPTFSPSQKAAKEGDFQNKMLEKMFLSG